ncbi:hypothetical protein E8E11_008822 [Didymella keratinophila]|nr:hypothetical protein E8E11_008822 [Didymella keratinophila]
MSPHQVVGRLAQAESKRHHLENVTTPRDEYTFSVDRNGRTPFDLVIEEKIRPKDKADGLRLGEDLAFIDTRSHLVRSCIEELDTAAANKQVAHITADAQCHDTQPTPLHPASKLTQTLPAPFRMAGTKRKNECIDLTED